MLDFNMYNCKLHYNNVEIINDKNPYAEGTQEFILVKFILDNIDRINETQGDCDSSMLEYLGKEGLYVRVDSWSRRSLFNYALSLARAARLVRVSYDGLDRVEKKRFAVYLESGMVNMLNNIKYTDKLAAMKNEGKRNNLWEVLYVSDMVRKEMKIPELSMARVGYNREYTIKNFEGDWFDSLTSLPIASWSHPYPSDGWTRVNSRGIFHHEGDTMGFILAAMQYGECYIVGPNRLGGLVVLGSPMSQTFSFGQQVDQSDFDFIYGVPAGSASDLGDHGLYSGVSGSGKMSPALLEEKSDDYWHNKVFNKHKGREMGLFTLTGLVEKIYDQNLDTLARFGKLGTIEEMAALLREICDIWHDLLEKNMNEKFSIMPKQAVNGASEGAVQSFLVGSKFKTIRDKFSIQGMKMLKSECLAIINNDLVASASNVENEATLEIMANDIQDMFEKILKLVLLVEEENDNEQLINSLLKDSTFFYKTTMHKVHCEIVNPIGIEGLGFFLKSGDGEDSITRTTILSEMLPILGELVYREGLIGKNFDFKHEILSMMKSTLIGGLKDEAVDCFKYWDALNLKVFLRSEIVDMKNEYRMFVINNRVVATTPCFRNSTPFDAWERGVFDPRLCNGHSAELCYGNKETRLRVAKYAKFARKYCNEMKSVHPEITSYVLDVAWSDDLNRVIPIEMNSATWSGAYQIDMHRLCAAIAGKKYEKEQRNKKYSMRELKKKAAERMLADGILPQGLDYQI